MKEEKQREQEREGERGMADVELMKYLNSSGWDCDWLASDAGGGVVMAVTCRLDCDVKGIEGHDQDPEGGRMK
ncbi:hypothetical protein AG1IA_01277 [Rhizoctonia solani AG-1 IA]|uniref:Uncharacterized protein n=1 Tax=Thanatephorus cucumeris (strain AG1-IA) TaxID=983506 RepID=L8X6G4_THACA|nr:hypothetical protein AG1IA_01277 [Rhizoctonia solani AG-1 IA]